MDANIKITVNKKNMRVTANFIPATKEGEKLSCEDILAKLASMSITTGIREDAAQWLCESDRPVNAAVLAEGIPPQVGEKAKIETYVKINIDMKAKFREDGSVDFRDLGEVTSVKAGQELYRKIPPTLGKSGLDVCGKEIQGLLGRDLRIVRGPGTVLDENDPNLVKAAIDGKLFMRDGIMEVSEIHEVRGDVDYSTGNIKFNGAIQIRGTVKSGFQVVADGNVEIFGNVEDSVVISGGDAIIHGGCVGSGEGSVSARQDVYVKFVENQKIEADRDIIINGESFHATLLAGRSIISQGKNSTLVGGSCETKISVEAATFGSISGTPTIIRIGTDPKHAEKLRKVEMDIKQATESLEKLEKSVVFLYRQKIDLKGKLPPEKQVLLEKLETAKKLIPMKLEALKKAKDDLQERQAELEQASATARKAIFPKVQIFVGNQRFTVEDNLGPSVFRLIQGEIARLSK